MASIRVGEWPSPETGSLPRAAVPVRAVWPVGVHQSPKGLTGQRASHNARGEPLRVRCRIAGRGGQPAGRGWAVGGTGWLWKGCRSDRESPSPWGGGPGGWGCAQGVSASCVGGPAEGFQSARAHAQLQREALYDLRETDRDRFDAVEDSLRVAFPGFVRLDFPPVVAGTLAMTWKDSNFSRPSYMNPLSEGTLRFLWLATLLITHRCGDRLDGRLHGDKSSGLCQRR